MPSAGWDNYEQAERRRRIEHENVMQRLFGASSFDNERTRVEMIRDPRSGLEQIAFSLVEVRDGERG